MNDNSEPFTNQIRMIRKILIHFSFVTKFTFHFDHAQSTYFQHHRSVVLIQRWWWWWYVRNFLGQIRSKKKNYGECKEFFFVVFNKLP